MIDLILRHGVLTVARIQSYAYLHIRVKIMNVTELDALTRRYGGTVQWKSEDDGIWKASSHDSLEAVLKDMVREWNECRSDDLHKLIRYIKGYINTNNKTTYALTMPERLGVSSVSIYSLIGDYNAP